MRDNPANRLSPTGARSPGKLPYDRSLGSLFSLQANQMPSTPTIEVQPGQIGSATWSQTSVIQTSTQTYTQPVMLSLPDPARSRPVQTRRLPETPAPARASEPVLADAARPAAEWLPYLQGRLEKLALKAAGLRHPDTLLDFLGNAGFQLRTEKLLNSIELHLRQMRKAQHEDKREARHETGSATQENALTTTAGFLDARKTEMTVALFRSMATQVSLLAPYASMPDFGTGPTREAVTMDRAGARNVANAASAMGTGAAGATNLADVTNAASPVRKTSENRHRSTTRSERKRKRQAEESPAEPRERKKIRSDQDRKAARAAVTATPTAVPTTPESGGHDTPGGKVSELASELTSALPATQPKRILPRMAWPQVQSPATATLQESMQALLDQAIGDETSLPARSSETMATSETMTEHSWVPGSPRSKVYERQRSERKQNELSGVSAATNQSSATPATPSVLQTAAEPTSARSVSERKRKYEAGAMAGERQVKRARKGSARAVENADLPSPRPDKKVQASPYSTQRVHSTLPREKKE